MDEPELDFSREVEIDPSELVFKPFWQTAQVKAFHCGVKDLDDFLNTEEVEKYEKSQGGKTTLVFYRGDLVAYFTLTNSSIKTELLRKVKSFSRDPELVLNSYGAVLIGRLAVDEKWARKGLGREIMARIVGYCLKMRETSAVKFLIVQSYEKSMEFYFKMGFDVTNETRNERKLVRQKGTRTMYLDIDKVLE